MGRPGSLPGLVRLFKAQRLASEPSLVLSDWNMPEMTGIELLTELRRLGSRVRFGCSTTEGMPPVRESAAAAGARE